MIESPSMNALANARQLAPFASWEAGAPPAGYVGLPMADTATRFYQEYGFLVVEDAFDADAIGALNREAAAICRGERGAVRV